MHESLLLAKTIRKASAMPGPEPAVSAARCCSGYRGLCVSDSQDGLGQLTVSGLKLRGLLENVLERGFQLYTPNFACAGDEAGGVVMGGTNDLVVFQRGRHLGGGVGGCVRGPNDCIGGDNEARSAGAGGSNKQGYSAQQAEAGHGQTPERSKKKARTRRSSETGWTRERDVRIGPLA